MGFPTRSLQGRRQGCQRRARFASTKEDNAFALLRAARRSEKPRRETRFSPASFLVESVWKQPFEMDVLSHFLWATCGEWERERTNRRSGGRARSREALEAHWESARARVLELETVSKCRKSAERIARRKPSRRSLASPDTHARGRMPRAMRAARQALSPESICLVANLFAKASSRSPRDRIRRDAGSRDSSQGHERQGFGGWKGVWAWKASL